MGADLRVIASRLLLQRGREFAIRAVSARREAKGDSQVRADLIQDAGCMEAGMDGQPVVDGLAVASAGRG